MNSSIGLTLNSTCSRNFSETLSQNNESTVESFIESYVFMTYTKIIPSICGLSIFICILVIIGQSFLIFTNDAYKLLFLRTILSVLISIINIGVQDSSCLTCRSNSFTSFFNNFTRLYISRGCFLALVFSVVLLEIFMMNSRITLIKNKKNFISKIGANYQCVIAIIFPMLVHSPDFFAYFVHHECDNIYSRKLTWFGGSTYYFYYNLFIYSSQIIFGVIYITLTIICIIAYKAFIRNKKKIMKNFRQQNSLTKVAVFLAAIYLFNIVVYFLFVVLDQIFLNFENLRNFIRYSVFITNQTSVLIVHIMLFYFDKKLRTILKEKLSKLKNIC